MNEFNKILRPQTDYVSDHVTDHVENHEIEENMLNKTNLPAPTNQISIHL